MPDFVPTDNSRFKDNQFQTYWCDPHNPSIGEWRVVEHTGVSDGGLERYSVTEEFDSIDLTEILTWR